ncbi:putative membrane protein [Candidatus Nanobsidianus stetteri]|uniref:Putative membrane protein n=1 Tax=Nanobsidianus stetteri TaxID=1294122 RepID=R1G979_NANST|nr:putative membrane protein [Candidatus Nanobsidianus stetteri]
MIKSKIGIILIIIFFIIGYFYIKSIFLGLLLASIYVKIFSCLYIILFSLNFALISFMIINYRKFYKGNILSFISAIFGFAGFQACLVGCGTGSFAILVATLAPIFGLNIFEFGEILLVVSDILFIVNLIFLLGLNKRKDIKKLKISKNNKEDSCCDR